MSRTLARAPFTADEVAAALIAPVRKMRCRFELCTRDFAIVDPDLKVLSAVVDWNGTRAVGRGLTMTMPPRYDLVGVPFQYLVLPYWGIQIDDRGYAEFPFGAFVWTEPTRNLWDRTTPQGAELTAAETWQVVLGDQMHYIDASGPGDDPAGNGQLGYYARTSMKITDRILDVLNRTIPGRDFSGVAPAATPFPQNLGWTLASGASVNTSFSANIWKPLDDQTLTWTAILRLFHSMLGYEAPYFDIDKYLYRARLGTSAESPPVGTQIISYAFDSTSRMVRTEQPTTITPDFTQIANRSFTLSKTVANGINYVGRSELDNIDLGGFAKGKHPLARSKINFYIDTVAQLPTGSTTELKAAAEKLLRQHAAGYQRLVLRTLMNPQHDAHEVVSLRVPGDPVFGNEMLMDETAWSADLFAGTMEHTLLPSYVFAQGV